MSNTNYVQVPWLSHSSPWKPGSHAIGLAFSPDMQRFAIAVARREAIPIVVRVHEREVDEHGLHVFGAIFAAAGKYGTRTVHTAGVELPYDRRQLFLQVSDNYFCS